MMEDGVCRGIFLLVVLFSNVIQVITGFAGTLLAMPFSIRLIGMTEAKVILNFLGLAASLIICLRSRKQIEWRILGRIAVWMLAGMVVGLWMAKQIPMSFLLIPYGIVIIGIAVKNLVKPGIRPLGGIASALLLLLAGLLHGLFVSGGALLVLYAAQAIPEKTRFRATVSAVWVILNGTMFAGHVYAGYLDRRTIGLGTGGMLMLILAYVVGNRLHRMIKQETFLRLTYFLLIVSGMSILL